MSEIEDAILFLKLQGAERAANASFRPEEICFPEQNQVRHSQGRRKVLRCGRRAGKTRLIAVALHEAIQAAPHTNVYYITLTLKNARRIIWAEVKRLNEIHGLGGVPNETDASMAFPALGHDVHIYLGGAKDMSEVEKWRGTTGKLWVIDETQAFPQRIIGPLIRDAIQPIAMDHQGAIWLAGTCPPLRSGYFWEVDSGALKDGWEHFRWTVRENVKLPARVAGLSIEAILDDVLKENGWLPDNPTFRREYLNEWVVDESALVFKWSSLRNSYAVLPKEKMQYVLGVDLGFEDADAIAVLGWTAHSPIIYLVEEYVERKSGITPLAEKIAELRAKYRPVKIVADFGGLGKKIAIEITRRFTIPLEPAEKVRKFEHIELLNDAMLGSRFRCLPSSAFAEDATLVQWDLEARAKGILKIAEDFHSDITDAVLYGFRACYGYLSRPPPEPPKDENEARIAALLREQKLMNRGDETARRLGYDGDD